MSLSFDRVKFSFKGGVSDALSGVERFSFAQDPNVNLLLNFQVLQHLYSLMLLRKLLNQT